MRGRRVSKHAQNIPRQDLLVQIRHACARSTRLLLTRNNILASSPSLLPLVGSIAILPTHAGREQTWEDPTSRSQQQQQQQQYYQPQWPSQHEQLASPAVSTEQQAMHDRQGQQQQRLRRQGQQPSTDDSPQHGPLGANLAVQEAGREAGRWDHNYTVAEPGGAKTWGQGAPQDGSAPPAMPDTTYMDAGRDGGVQPASTFTRSPATVLGQKSFGGVPIGGTGMGTGGGGPAMSRSAGVEGGEVYVRGPPPVPQQNHHQHQQQQQQGRNIQNVGNWSDPNQQKPAGWAGSDGPMSSGASSSQGGREFGLGGAQEDWQRRAGGHVSSNASSNRPVQVSVTGTTRGSSESRPEDAAAAEVGISSNISSATVVSCDQRRHR